MISRLKGKIKKVGTFHTPTVRTKHYNMATIGSYLVDLLATRYNVYIISNDK